MKKLTAQERKIVNKAMDIIMANQAHHSSTQLYWSHYKGLNPSFSMTYFDSADRQHSNFEAPTLADLLDKCAGWEAKLPSPGEVRAEKIANLKRQLEALEGGAA